MTELYNINRFLNDLHSSMQQYGVSIYYELDRKHSRPGAEQYNIAVQSGTKVIYMANDSPVIDLQNIASTMRQQCPNSMGNIK